MNNRAGEARFLWYEYNASVFGNKLVEPVIKIDDRASSYWGKFIYSWSGRTDKKITDRSRVIVLSGDYDEGVLLHEMIHQYQFEVLSRQPSHDAIFNSIARKIERMYALEVR